MIVFNIPGVEKLNISHLLLDYNGTIAIDGSLIKGVGEAINQLSGKVHVHVVTADTFGSVGQALGHVDCKVHILSEGQQDEQKLAYLLALGEQHTICVGNGVNDTRMLEKSILGIGVLQDEGLAGKALFACDLVVKDILDVFAFFQEPDRLAATLRN